MNKYIGNFISISITCTLLMSCATGPEALIRVHAYEGQPKSNPEIATVYAFAAYSLICTVDGKSYRRMGAISNCPSVVYLLPGKHELGFEVRGANVISTTTIPTLVQGGKTYQASLDNTQTRINIHEMPPGFTLTYKDLSPRHFVDGSRTNSVIDPSTAK